jgi:hypothetical protein
MIFSIIKGNDESDNLLSRIDDQLINYYSEKAFTGNFRFPIRRCFGSAEKITVRAFLFGENMISIRNCKECGIEFKSTGPKPTFCSRNCQRNNRTTKLDIKKLAKLYESGLTQVEIAKQFNTTKKVISGAMRRNGIKAHTPQTSKLSAYKQNKVEYSAYKCAQARCLNSSKEGFHNYGGRGIQFRFSSFEDFLAEVGRRPSPAYSIDRINVDGHYEKGNVQWATKKEQARNRRGAKFITLNNETKTLAEWAEINKVKYNTVFSRLERNYCEQCLFKPSKPIVYCSHRFSTTAG